MSEAIATRRRRGWWRRQRRAVRRTQAQARRPTIKPWNAMILTAVSIAVLVAFDQMTKARLVTEEWAWHTQPTSWLVYPLIGLFLAVPFLYFPVTRTTGILVFSGIFGNLMSELRFDRVANPIQFQNGTVIHAFNVADVYIILALAAAAIAGVRLFALTVNAGGN